MSAIPQVTLADNEQFLQSIGYLAVINATGPFSGRNATRGFTNCKIREKVADVQVGDDAWTGAEWGKVSAKTSTKITVQFAHSIKPAGVANEDYNPIRTEVYPVSLDAPVAGTTQDNSYQTLSGIGVVFTYLVPTTTALQTITLQSAVPTIHATADPIVLNFSAGGVSVQKTVGGVNSGVPVIADASGIVSMPGSNTAGQLIRYVVSKAGYTTATFGPYTVVV